MAFDPNNPPSLIASGIGGSRGLKAWAWKHSDPIATVIGSGYIRTARKLGMGVGDAVRYVDSSNDPHYLVLSAIDADTGYGTVSFPETAPEAYPVDGTPSGTIYVVAYVDGVQSRVDPALLPAGALTYASQAEAETGTDTDNPMNALRVFQGIAAYITGRAAKTPPVDADGLVITDSAAAGAPKQVTWANIKAAMFAAWGVLLAAATAKTTPVDADVMLLADSAASNATKKVTWANLKATVMAALGTTIAALTGKTTPVDADTLALSDSAAAGVGKSLTWANVKATLLTYLLGIFPRFDAAATLTQTNKGQVAANIGQAWEQIGARVEVGAGGVTQVAWTGLSAYRQLRIAGFALPETDGVALALQLSSDNGSSYIGTATYNYQLTSAAAAAISTAATTGGTSLGLTGSTGNLAAEGVGVLVRLERFNKAAVTHIFGECHSVGSDGAPTMRSSAGFQTGATAMDALRLVFNAGDIAELSYFTLEGQRG